MCKLKLFALAAVAASLIGAPALAAGNVTSALRPTLRVFDEKGQPLGQIKATDLTYPAPIVGMGVGGSVGVKQGARVVYLRGLDVVTDKVKANCKPVQTAARAKGTAYAAQNMGLGGAADCQ
ncbi:MAG: hypothetical protein ACXWVJ_02470 [Caulobacteraceae bacterium]